MKLQLLGQLVEIKTGKLDANAAIENGQYPFFTCAKKESRIDKFSFDCEAILIAGNGDLNVKRYKGKFDAYQRTYVLSIKSSTDVHFEYLYYFLEGYVEKLREMSIGGVIKYIKLGMLTEAKIPLPPLETQKQIAAVLEKADQLRKDCLQMEQELNSLAQSVFIDMFGDPVTNPKGWDVRSFKEFIVNLRNGISPSKGGQLDFQVLTLSAITRGRYNDEFCKVGSFNSEPDNTKKVTQNDFLICRGNGNKKLVGRGVYPTQSRDDLVFPDTVIAATLNLECLDIRYFNTLWSSDLMREHIEGGARTTNGTFKINQKVINDAPVLCPPVELQKEFGKVIENVNVLIEQNQMQLKELDENFNALMKKAFIGELNQ
jgi:type I restriction enzyme S subunit